MPTKTVRARITGRVQGVAFRAWTEAEATRRGLSGWVRNEPDGTVNALLHGPEEEVDAMLAALHRGPRLAKVDSVASEPAAPPDRPGDFRILR